MSVTPIRGLDIQAIEAEARKEIAQEKTEKAKKALLTALRRLDSARQVVTNIEREVEDLKASIEDGSFVG